MTENQPQVVSSLDQVPGRVHTIEGPDGEEQKLRVVEGAFAAPRELGIELLHEQEGLCAWVGRRDDKGRILDAVPVFTAGELGNDLSHMAAGAVLLTDLARDLTVENRLAGHNFAVANADSMTEHVMATYGAQTAKVIHKEFLSGKIGVATAKFLAARMVRIMKVNYLEATDLFEQDGTRMRLKQPFKLMTRFDSAIQLNNMVELALWLGARWLEAEKVLLEAYPHLKDRSEFFRASVDGEGEPGAEAGDSAAA